MNLFRTPVDRHLGSAIVLVVGVVAAAFAWPDPWLTLGLLAGTGALVTQWSFKK